MTEKRNNPFTADNIASMYTPTALAMIFSSLTGVIAVLIDGIIASRFVGSDIYSGMSLLRPFTSVVVLLSSFLSTGCNIVCSHLIGNGEKEKANMALNLSLVIALLFSAVLVLAVLIVPDWLLQLCGVSLTKYPELNPHMYGYLHGLMIGVPAMMLVEIFGPMLVMDNGKKLFSVSSTVLCVANIAGDLLNAFVFHGGAFGMGLVTAAAYILQLLIMLLHFRNPDRFFRLSPKLVRLEPLKEIIQGGSPTLVKRLASTVRDILINNFNMMAALTTAAIAARGIQNDLFTFLFCISTGLGRTLATMSGMYYGANDIRGLKRLYSYAMKFGIQVSFVAAAIVFGAARLLSRMYTDDAEVIALAAFSIRWMSAGLVFDTILSLLSHYLQGTKNLKLLDVINIGERFVVPVATAFILGRCYGTKGILASAGITKFVLVLLLFLYVCWRCKGLPKRWEDVMFLPEGFGGEETDNLYAVIRTLEDIMQASREAQDFCREHGADARKAYYLSLCIEEMAVNILDHARKDGHDEIYVDFRLFVSEGRICFSLRDLHRQFDPTAYYQLHIADSPEAHIGIRIVTKMAKEVRYFSAFNSNNLIVFID